MTNLVRTKQPELRRTKQPMRLNSKRRELERIVVAWNTRLVGVVSTMHTVILLRNAPPSFRSDYAYKLRDEGLIKDHQIVEFIIHPTPKLNFNHPMHV